MTGSKRKKMKKKDKKIENDIFNNIEKDAPKTDKEIDKDFETLLPPEIEEEPEIKTEPKKKRKARKKSLQPEENLKIGSLVLMPLNWILQHLASFYNEPGFILNQIETEQLSQCLDKVGSKHLPLWFEKYSDEIGLLFISFTIFYPRFVLWEGLKKATDFKSSNPIEENKENNVNKENKENKESE